MSTTAQITTLKYAAALDELDELLEAGNIGQGEHDVRRARLLREACMPVTDSSIKFLVGLATFLGVCSVIAAILWLMVALIGIVA